MAERGKVYPGCVNASNAYHECGDYCLRVIAEANRRTSDDQTVEDTWLKYIGGDVEKVQEVAADHAQRFDEHQLALDELRARVTAVDSKLDQTVKLLKERPIELRVEIDDNTKKVQGAAADHAQRLDNHQLALDELIGKVTAVDIKLDQTLKQLKERPIELPSPDSHCGSIGGSIRLNFPHFNGDDPAGWIFKAERFFEYYFVPDDQRLLIASIHMDGQALQWFMLMSKCQCEEISSWDQFTRALETRFGPSEFEDHQGALLKLVQTSTVEDYLTRFEALANRIVGLSPSLEMAFFVSGLRSDIRSEVLARRPMSTYQAMILARQQEAKLKYQLQQEWPKWSYSSTTT